MRSQTTITKKEDLTVLKMKQLVIAAACMAAVVSQATAQPPGDRPAIDRNQAKPRDLSNSPLVTRMMAFDKEKTGKLTKDMITDERLQRLFDEADANKDGVVTKDELIALATKFAAEDDQDPDRGPGGPGGRGPGGQGGPGGRGGRGPGGPPQPGQILPTFMRDQLNLTSEQKAQLDALQKEVDEKLGKILTDAQKKQLKNMRPGGRGPGGPGGRGPGGPGGPGGPPPDREGPPPERRE
jgi:hypothetical protein